jgi:hypothetical protein
MARAAGNHQDIQHREPMAFALEALGHAAADRKPIPMAQPG